MVVATASQKTFEEYEEELVRQIDKLTYIIHGLENYEPYNRVIEMFRETRSKIDDSWHLIGEPQKLTELRITKYAVNTLIDYIPNLKQDLERFQMELVKLQNPDELVNKDYDER